MSLQRRHRQIAEMAFTVPNTTKTRPFSLYELRNFHADRSMTPVQKMRMGAHLALLKP